MANAKKKIIVIGSNSFSAGHLIKKLLQKKYKVVGISRSKLNEKHFLSFNHDDPNFVFFKADLNKNYQKIFHIIVNTKPNYIINFSAQSMVGESWDNPVDWYQTNALSTIRLYNFIFNYKKIKKLIHISTPEIYGSIKNKAKETKIYHPNSPYAASRVAADQYLETLYNNFNFNYCSVRASNVFGENQRIYRIIPKAIYCILKKKKLPLDGGGSSKRNFIHMENVSDAIYKIMNAGKAGHIYHVSGKQIISIEELIKKICKIMKYNFNALVKNSNERKGKDKFYYLSSEKIKKELKWEEKVNLDEGLIRTISWVKKNLSLFNKNDEKYIHKK
jgi:dTDP-glucose 4,6-dehydratase